MDGSREPDLPVFGKRSLPDLKLEFCSPGPLLLPLVGDLKVPEK